MLDSMEIEFGRRKRAPKRRAPNSIVGAHLDNCGGSRVGGLGHWDSKMIMLTMQCLLLSLVSCRLYSRRTMSGR